MVEEKEESERQRRQYKTKHQVELLLTEMEHQIIEGRTDTQMTEFFNIGERSFYYFKRKLYERSLAIQTSKKTEETIAMETTILKERLIKVYQHLEDRMRMVNQNPEINENMGTLALATYQIAKNIMQLEAEGLRVFSAFREKKNIRYINEVYQNIPNCYNDNNGKSENF